MGKRIALLAIRLLLSVNLLYAAIFLKFAGAPGSVSLFNQMSQSVHGLVSQPVFRVLSARLRRVDRAGFGQNCSSGRSISVRNRGVQNRVMDETGPIPDGRGFPCEAP
jgi:hypothetical protein